MTAMAADAVMVDRQQLNAALVLSGFAFLIPTINGIVQIYNGLRRKPPIDQELQFYAKKADLASVEQRLQDQLSACCARHEKAMEKHNEDQTRVVENIFSRVNAAQNAMEKTFRDIMHELGTLTGRIK